MATGKSEEKRPTGDKRPERKADGTYQLPPGAVGWKHGWIPVDSNGNPVARTKASDKAGHTQGTKDAIDQAYRNRDEADAKKAATKAAAEAKANTRKTDAERKRVAAKTIAESARQSRKAQAEQKRTALAAQRQADKDLNDAVRLAEKDEKAGRQLTTHQKAVLAAARTRQVARERELRGGGASKPQAAPKGRKTRDDEGEVIYRGPTIHFEDGTVRRDGDRMLSQRQLDEISRKSAEARKKLRAKQSKKTELANAIRRTVELAVLSGINPRTGKPYRFYHGWIPRVGTAGGGARGTQLKGEPTFSAGHIRKNPNTGLHQAFTPTGEMVGPEYKNPGTPTMMLQNKRKALRKSRAESQAVRERLEDRMEAQDIRERLADRVDADHAARRAAKRPSSQAEIDAAVAQDNARRDARADVQTRYAAAVAEAKTRPAVKKTAPKPRSGDPLRPDTITDANGRVWEWKEGSVYRSTNPKTGITSAVSQNMIQKATPKSAQQRQQLREAGPKFAPTDVERRKVLEQARDFDPTKDRHTGRPRTGPSADPGYDYLYQGIYLGGRSRREQQAIREMADKGYLAQARGTGGGSRQRGFLNSGIHSEKQYVLTEKGRQYLEGLK